MQRRFHAIKRARSQPHPRRIGRGSVLATIRSVIDVREILDGSTELAAEAMLVLRPRWGTPAELIDVIDTHLRPVGYRLVGVLLDDEVQAVAVAGFREVSALAWGNCLYVDDLSLHAAQTANLRPPLPARPVGQQRALAVQAHAAAREIGDPAAVAAARAVGHAAGTTQMAAHARGTAAYATKAAG